MFDVLSDFAIYCRVERRFADLTCKGYERDVAACLRFLSAEGIGALLDVRTADLRRFLALETTRRPSPSSQARTIAALHSFFRFCVENEHLERDPALVLRTPKKRETLPDILDRTELFRLLEAPGRKGVWQRVHPGKLERDRLLLGHKHLDSTQRYTRVNAHQLRGAVERLPWTTPTPDSARTPTG